jgi:hypothetical protein
MVYIWGKVLETKCRRMNLSIRSFWSKTVCDNVHPSLWKSTNQFAFHANMKQCNRVTMWPRIRAVLNQLLYWFRVKNFTWKSLLCCLWLCSLYHNTVFKAGTCPSLSYCQILGKWTVDRIMGNFASQHIRNETKYLSLWRESQSVGEWET